MKDERRRIKAGIIWDILITHCGASVLEDDRGCFIMNTSFEYRFQGNLGFGGKFILVALRT